MASKGYTDQEAVQNYLLQTIDGSFLNQFDEWLEGVEGFIEKLTGRVFIADTVASTRLFEGNCSNKLLIDECIEVTKVEQGDTYGESFSEISSGDYQKLPYNYVAEKLPVNAIGLKRTVWGIGVHRITAKWGFSAAVPADIKFAATVLLGGILWAQINPDGEKKSETIGNYSVAYKDAKGDADYDRAFGILESYRRISL